MTMDKFVDCYSNNVNEPGVDAGVVGKYLDNFNVICDKKGIKETFSVGQPVYDRYGHIMGYLGIGLYQYVNYWTDCNIKIPMEYWMICLPTEHCVEGKQVYTYWQHKKRKEMFLDNSA